MIKTTTSASAIQVNALNTEGRYGQSFCSESVYFQNNSYKRGPFAICYKIWSDVGSDDWTTNINDLNGWLNISPNWSNSILYGAQVGKKMISLTPGFSTVYIPIMKWHDPNTSYMNGERLEVSWKNTNGTITQYGYLDLCNNFEPSIYNLTADVNRYGTNNPFEMYNKKLGDTHLLLGTKFLRSLNAVNGFPTNQVPLPSQYYLPGLPPQDQLMMPAAILPMVCNTNGYTSFELILRTEYRPNPNGSPQLGHSGTPFYIGRPIVMPGINTWLADQ